MQQTNLNVQVQIDENWISSSSKQKPMIDPSLLLCQVCCGIPLGQYAQCIQCGRIYCQKDYQAVSCSLNACPNCKNSPFTKKAKPHILYNSVFDRITFQCQLCDQQICIQDDQSQKMEEKMDYKQEEISQEKNENENENEKIEKPRSKILLKQKTVKTYTKDDLYIHINDHHKAKIMDFNILFDYEVFFDKGNDKIVLDFYQNMELNQKFFQFQNKKKGSTKDFPYQLDNGHIIVIDLSNQRVSSPTLQKTGIISRKPSKQLKKDIQYDVWEVRLDMDYKYFTQKAQQQISKNYKQFLHNKRLNEFTFDIKAQRYRISFTKMKQINTFTEYERPIRKTTVKFQ